MSRSGDRFADLPRERRVLLEQLLVDRARLAATTGRGRASPSIPRRGEGEPRLLSLAQQRLWFLAQLAPASPVYNVAYRLHVSGALDERALARALHAFVGRHEILRTRMIPLRGHPATLLSRSWPPPLRSVDLRGSPEHERAREIARLLADEAARPFDLARDGLLRCALFRTSEDTWELTLVSHHLAWDLRSKEVFFVEIGPLYEASLAGRDPSRALPELPVQYADYALWQRRGFTDEALAALAAYWTTALRGATPAPALPADRPRPLHQSFAGARLPVRLPGSLLDAVKALGRQAGATPYMTLLAAFQLLLAALAGADDVVVGTPVSGRSALELEGLVGFFVNTIVLRARVDPARSFRDFLGAVRRTTLDALQHQELPFDKLVEILRPPRDLGQTPLFQVNFRTQDALPAPREVAGVRVAPPELVDTSTAKFDLALEAPVSESAEGYFEYSTDLFDEATIARWRAGFEALLGDVVAAPDAPVGGLPAVRAQLSGSTRPFTMGPQAAPNPRAPAEPSISAMTQPDTTAPAINQTAAPFPAEAGVHEIFEAQAARTPDRVALLAGGEAWSYASLNARANQLAHLLRRAGVAPGDRVGLFGDRAGWTIAALLGILKAGAAYVPLSPAAPRARLAGQLEEIRAAAVVTEERLLAALPAFAGPIVCLDRDERRLAGEPREDPPRAAGAAELAYVMYTSGSTGAPKGVAITHASLARYTRAIADLVGPAEGLSFAVVSTLAADLGNTCIFPSLTAGGTLVVLDRDTAMDGDRLGAFAAQHPLDVLKITPSHLEALLAARDGRRALPRRLLITGGEALRFPLVDRVRAESAVRWINHYGPTETTVGSLTFDLADLPAARAAATVPIGRPLPGTRAYVLDEQRAPVPEGSPGELYLGGSGVARGYLGRDAETAARFLPDPFAGVDGARMYRTGDRVRVLPDGNHEFFGRVDRQVKIRGFRVEPGEIEAALLRHAGVREAVVAAREDRPGEARLVAFVVPTSGPISPRELQMFLAESLPEHMLPSALVLLDALPLTENGKVDPLALPDPGEARERAAAHVAPRTPIEEALAALWGEVLGVARVGALDDFFELGGHSLAVIQVVARARSAFGVEIPLRALFDRPTLAAFAAEIECCPRGAEDELSRLVDDLGLTDAEVQELLAAERALEAP